MQRPQPHTPPRHPTRLTTLGLPALLLLSACAAGCDQTQAWDTEFHCVGQEESIATFLNEAPDKAMRKTYPHNIDFHLRSGTAMVRSALVKVDDTSAAVMHFEARNGAVWMGGQFDQQSQRLSLVEERTLELEGRPQQVRISGQYQCSNAAATKGPAV